MLKAQLLCTLVLNGVSKVRVSGEIAKGQLYSFARQRGDTADACLSISVSPRGGLDEKLCNNTSQSGLADEMRVCSFL